jgi:hypothetical protein
MQRPSDMVSVLTSRDGCLLDRWWWCFESSILSHHSTKRDANTFDDSQEDGAADGIVAHGFGSTSNRKCASREEASDDGIPWIFLLPVKISVGV